MKNKIEEVKVMRVVHYINQFFAQIGGEEAANAPLEVREGAVGPGKALEIAFDGKAHIVATIICGDNNFVENTDALSSKIEDILKKYKADLLVAGPAFNAGRYGMACGNVCKIAQESLGIPAVSGMFKENPAVDIFKSYAYIFPTANSARGMKEAIEKISTLVKKIADNKKLLGPDGEGYFKRGIRKNVFVEKTGAQRAVDMILKKVHGQPFKTELEMPKFTRVKPSKPIGDIKTATIALMTSGGIVPKGNPDHLEACFCSKFKKYQLEDYGGAGLANSEVAHGGYDPTFANEDANRVLPVDEMMELEKEGVIGKLYPYFYVTVGNGASVERATDFGNAIGKELSEEGIVQGVILTST